MGDGKVFSMRDDLNPELKSRIKNLMDNFLIVFVKRAGGKIEIPVKEVDEANDLLTMNIDIEKRVFILETKQRN